MRCLLVMAVLAAAPAVAAPADVGARLDALEAEVAALKARNAALEAALGRARTSGEEAAKAVQWAAGPAPTLARPDGSATFKPRGTIDLETAAYLPRAGGYEFNSGTAARRSRFGFEGLFARDFGFRVEAEFVSGQARLFDAYVTYAGVPHVVVTVGQSRAPFSLGQMDPQTTFAFQERAMFVNAFAGPSAGRRLGALVEYQRRTLNAALGVYGENDTLVRGATPGEGMTVTGRIAWEPVLTARDVVHVGVGGFRRTGQRDGDARGAVRLSDRPSARVDGTPIADTGSVPGVTDVIEWNAEAAVMHGPFHVQAEYGRATLDRLPGLRSVTLQGGYVYGTWAVTGEHRGWRGGVPDRLRPLRPFSRRDGPWGALELGVRYDTADFSDTPTRVGNTAETLTTAVNWYLSANLRWMFQWVRFDGRMTPLDPVGDRTAGDVLQSRVHLDF